MTSLAYAGRGWLETQAPCWHKPSCPCLDNSNQSLLDSYRRWHSRVRGRLFWSALPWRFSTLPLLCIFKFPTMLVLPLSSWSPSFSTLPQHSNPSPSLIIVIHLSQVPLQTCIPKLILIWKVIEAFLQHNPTHLKLQVAIHWVCSESQLWLLPLWRVSQFVLPTFCLFTSISIGLSTLLFF